MLSVAVEGETDRVIAKALLARAGMPKVKVLVAKRSLTPRQSWRWIDGLGLERPLIVVYDQEGGSVGDAVRTNEPSLDVFFCPAIPTVEAWLFADSEAFFEVLGDRADPFIGRLPLPEQLPYPKFLRSTTLRDPKALHRLLERINILVAGARSPSLKYFIQTAREACGLPLLPFDQPSNDAGQVNREVLRNLISEVYPSGKPLFRASSGAVVTAEQMMQEITDGSELGREYSSDILRVARDLLARQARKKAGKAPNDE